MLRKGVKLLIKKMVDYKKALVAILENTLENVNAGNTNITEEEASVIIDHLTMLNKGVATVSKAYACEHVLHITSNKFDYLEYIQIDNQLKQLVQEALINSVKNVIEQSPNGKELLTQQLNYIKSSKNAIVAESNRKLELFEKFQIAAKANPNLTYKEFCESINK